MMRRTEIREGHLRLVPVGDITPRELIGLAHQQADAALLCALNGLGAPAPSELEAGHNTHGSKPQDGAR